MRNLFLGLAAVACMSAAVASADVVLDNFEGYADQAAMAAIWKDSNNVAGTAETGTLSSTDGANGTTKYISLHDGGFGAAWGTIATTTPAFPDRLQKAVPAGTYKLGFYYWNGKGGTTYWRATNVFLKLGTTSVITVPITAAAQTGWTYVESSIVSLAAGNYELDVVGSHGSAIPDLALDEFKLISAAMPVTVDATPGATIRLSGTQNIVAQVLGGTGTYSSVTFDVGANGTIEGTDNTAPFEFSWNTVAATAASIGTSDSIALRIIATDSASATGTFNGTYRINNFGAGPVSLVSNGDFSGAWVGTGNQIPAGWEEFSTDANYSFWGPGDATEQRVSGNACLEITAAANFASAEVALERYKIRSTPVTGQFSDLQAACYGKGGFARLQGFVSNDAGATWAKLSQTPSVTVDTAFWSYVVGPNMFNQSGAGGYAGTSATSKISIAPHSYFLGSYYWDDVSFTGVNVSAAGVNEWLLY